MKTAKPPSIHNFEYKGDSDKEGSWVGASDEESSDEEIVKVKPVKNMPLQQLKSLMSDATTVEYDKLVEGLKATQNEMDAQLKQMAKGKSPLVTHDFIQGLCKAESAHIPHRLQMPDIEKYSGNSDPILFMDGYLLAMGPLHLGDDTVLKIFPRYLTDIAHS